ncbi:hypothetical protein KJ849_04765 [bacterium]|nr:hypothetical protein [bacterium]
MEIAGLFHVHSVYSYDGELSLEEIIALAQKHKYRFVVLNEHPNEFSQEKYKELLANCQRLSSQDFCLLPGMEFACDNNCLHILALGLQDLTFENDPVKILDFIRSQGGLAILAHPYRKEAYKLTSHLLSKFAGIEIWNAREDGKGMPKFQNIKMLRRLRREGYKLLGFGGLDLHNLKDFGLVKTIVKVKDLSAENLLKAFKEGNFYIKKGIFAVDSQGNIKYLGEYFYILSRFLYASFKNIAKLIEKLFQLLKIKPPEFMMKIARKLF